VRRDAKAPPGESPLSVATPTVRAPPAVAVVVRPPARPRTPARPWTPMRMIGVPAAPIVPPDTVDLRRRHRLFQRRRGQREGRGRARRNRQHGDAGKSRRSSTRQNACEHEILPCSRTAPFAEACAAAKEAIAAASLSQNARLSSRFLALVLFYARVGILRVKFGFIFDL
jgi:hypothetical protein